jgi:DNA-binding transcriptional LysR family regulator
MRKNELDELSAAELFLRVVQAGSFTKAAKTVGRSASTLSRAVSDLEAHVGAQLLARTTRRLHVTEAGSLYAAHAEQLLAARRAAHDAVAELTGGVPRGLLRVSMPVPVGERLLAPHLPAFRAQYPDLRLAIDLSDRNVALVEGGFDLAIRVGRFADSSLRAHFLGKIPVRLVASPSYLRARGTPKRPGDLARHTCIVTGPIGGAVEWPFAKRGVRTRVSIEGAVQTTSPTLAARLAVAGLGITRATEWVIREDLQRGRLVPLLADWASDDPNDHADGLPVFVLYAQAAGVDLPLKSRVFVELVKRVMATEVLPPTTSARKVASRDEARPRAQRRRARGSAVRRERRPTSRRRGGRSDHRRQSPRSSRRCTSRRGRRRS